MPITITVPSNTQTIGNTNHTPDHNSICTALNTLGTSSTNIAGDTFTGAMTFNAALIDPGGIQSPNSAYAGWIPISMAANTSTFTVTQSTPTALSNTYTINASDAKVGTVYRLTVAGTGTWGSTQQALGFKILALGASIGSLTVGSIQYPISTPFYWEVVGKLVIVSTGSSGSAIGSLSGQTAISNANEASGTGAQGTQGIVGVTSSPATVNTTTSGTIVLQGNWASTTGAPTISSFYSILERLGP